MFGINAFKAWGVLKIERNDDEANDRAGKASRLHKILVRNASLARDRVAQWYAKAKKKTILVNGTAY